MSEPQDGKASAAPVSEPSSETLGEHEGRGGSLPPEVPGSEGTVTNEPGGDLAAESDPGLAEGLDPAEFFYGDDGFDELDADLPEDEGVEGFREGDFVFYPQIGHCDVGTVVHDARTDLDFLELTPLDATEGNRILIPVNQLANRGIRHTGTSPGVIEEVLGSDFEPTIEDASERLDLIIQQEREGSVESLSLALKRLHLRYEMKKITREEQKRRMRIRKWLVVEYMTEKEGTIGQAQSAITRLLGKTMRAVREREREAARAKARRERAARKKAAAEKRAARERKKAAKERRRLLQFQR